MTRRFVAFVAIMLVGVQGFSQGTFIKPTQEELAGQLNTITTAVPFLTIAPDSRAGAMGDVGAATTPDINSLHWNSAKYALIDSDFGLSLSYTPWLRHLIDDIDLVYLSGFGRIDDQQVIAGSLRYFSLGEIIFTDQDGNTLTTQSPSEFAIDVAYSRLFGKRVGGSIAVRYINSNLTGGQFIGDQETHPGRTVAADLGVYGEKDIELGGNDAMYAFGASINNIGGKISYTDEAMQNFLPINLRIGNSLSLDIDDYNSLMFAVDINKLLVPTPPVWMQDTATGAWEIIAGRDNTELSVASGMFGSFSDAPGGAKEEFHELKYSLGLEYWYAKQFALRVGYYSEHETKGNRKYFTAGLGLRLNVFGLDFAYLLPTTQNHPLAKTVRFSLIFNFNQPK